MQSLCPLIEADNTHREEILLSKSIFLDLNLKESIMQFPGYNQELPTLWFVYESIWLHIVMKQKRNKRKENDLFVWLTNRIWLSNDAVNADRCCYLIIFLAIFGLDHTLLPLAKYQGELANSRSSLLLVHCFAINQFAGQSIGQAYEKIIIMDLDIILFTL